MIDAGLKILVQEFMTLKKLDKNSFIVQVKTKFFKAMFQTVKIRKKEHLHQDLGLIKLFNQLKNRQMIILEIIQMDCLSVKNQGVS